MNIFYDTPAPEIDYRYNEKALFEEAKRYVDETYGTHYGTETGPQITEAIISSGKGLGFVMGSIMKYASRYGKKEGYNRKDLLKIIHYAIIAMHMADKEDAKKYTTATTIASGAISTTNHVGIIAGNVGFYTLSNNVMPPEEATLPPIDWPTPTQDSDD